MDFQRMLRYCTELDKNNNRPWFHENHDFYDQAKADFTELVEQIKFCVAERVDVDTGQSLLFADPKSMLYRIPRDARVHKDKPPYNPSFRARIAVDRKQLLPLGYFIRIAPGNCSHFGTGGWCPTPEHLTRARAHIAEHYEELESILDEAGLELFGDKLKRVPAGYDADHPAGEFLKYKDWFAICRFRDEELTDVDSFMERIAGEVERMEPLRRFLNEALREKIQNPWDHFRW